jgi:hypothetical protein
MRKLISILLSSIMLLSCEDLGKKIDKFMDIKSSAKQQQTSLNDSIIKSMRTPIENIKEYKLPGLWVNKEFDSLLLANRSLDENSFLWIGSGKDRNAPRWSEGVFLFCQTEDEIDKVSLISRDAYLVVYKDELLIAPRSNKSIHFIDTIEQACKYYTHDIVGGELRDKSSVLIIPINDQEIEIHGNNSIWRMIKYKELSDSEIFPYKWIFEYLNERSLAGMYTDSYGRKYEFTKDGLAKTPLSDFDYLIANQFSFDDGFSSIVEVRTRITCEWYEGRVLIKYVGSNEYYNLSPIK